jgi:hypothetical protein
VCREQQQWRLQHDRMPSSQQYCAVNVPNQYCNVR